MAQGRGDTRPPFHDDAVDAWNTLNRATRFEIIQDVLETRRYEWMGAYSSLEKIGYGNKTMRVRKKRKHTDHLCIVFYVKRKWRSAPKSPRTEAKRLPEFVYHRYAPKKGPSRICAIPTDVEELSTYHGVAQVDMGTGPPEKALTDARPGQLIAWRGNAWMRGVPTCLVRGAGDRRYVVGCHHVLGLGNRNAPSGAVTVGDRAGTPFGRLSPYMGRLDPVNPPGHDVGLVELDEVASKVLGETFKNLLPNLQRGSLGIDPDSSPGASGSDFVLFKPDGTRQVVTFHGESPDYVMNYVLGGTKQKVTLSRVYLFAFTPGDPTTEGGDSGAPIFTYSPKRFAAMHIGKTTNNLYSIAVSVNDILFGAEYYKLWDRSFEYAGYF